jgi:hypothetical protein
MNKTELLALATDLETGDFGYLETHFVKATRNIASAALREYAATLEQEPEMDALHLAILFHHAYERLAPSVGYDTRVETRIFDPESLNGKLMLAVCAEILPLLHPPAPTTQEPVAWMNVKYGTFVGAVVTASGELIRLYANPPKAEPAPDLTDDEIIAEYCKIADGKEWAIGGLKDAMPFARAVLKAQKEKKA